MTADARAPVTSDPEVSVADYDQMLAWLDAAIEEALYKIDGDGRLRDVEKEKVRVKYLRVIGYLVGQRRQVAQDRDLEAMAERIEELEGRRTVKA